MRAASLSGLGIGFLLILLMSASVVRADANANFVRQVYLDLLQHEPDSFTLNADDLLLSGTETRYDFVLSVEGTQEYEDVLIGQTYTHLLLRPADSTALATFEPFLSGAGTVEQMQATVLGSAEYFTNRASSTDAGFVDAMYQDVLGRLPDPFSLATLVNALTSNAATRYDEALSTLTSNEYRTDFITGVYSQFLHRTPSTFESAPLLTAMQSGTTDQQIVATVLASNEYFNLAQSVPEPAALFATVSMILTLRRVRRG